MLRCNVAAWYLARTGACLCFDLLMYWYFTIMFGNGKLFISSLAITVLFVRLNLLLLSITGSAKVV